MRLRHWEEGATLSKVPANRSSADKEIILPDRCWASKSREGSKTMSAWAWGVTCTKEFSADRLIEEWSLVFYLPRPLASLLTLPVWDDNRDY